MAPLLEGDVMFMVWEVTLWAGPCDGETVSMTCLAGSPFSALPAQLWRNGISSYLRDDEHQRYVFSPSPLLAPNAWTPESDA